MAAAAQRGARVTNQADRQVSGKTINLALQGGGAHGAFTWGVLDRLLQDERIAIEGIAATSAGAMNATVFAHGLTVGGRQGACSALTEFWRRLSEVACWSPLQPSLFDLWLVIVTFRRAIDEHRGVIVDLPHRGIHLTVGQA